MEDSEQGEMSSTKGIKDDASLVDEDREEALINIHSLWIDATRKLAHSNCISGNNDSASEHSITSEPEDPSDARNYIPADIEEAILLRAALDANQRGFQKPHSLLGTLSKTSTIFCATTTK